MIPATMWCVFARKSIRHQAAALKEVYNALKPGGILSVTEVIFDHTSNIVKRCYI